MRQLVEYLRLEHGYYDNQPLEHRHYRARKGDRRYSHGFRAVCFAPGGQSHRYHCYLRKEREYLFPECCADCFGDGFHVNSIYD